MPATRRSGVTGALIYLDGWFVQVLEGPAAILDVRLARLRRDPRHAAMQIRQRERVHARVFAGQPMALRTRACLDAGLLEAFGYRPGFPVAEFPADVLLRVRRAGLPPAALRLSRGPQAGFTRFYHRLTEPLACRTPAVYRVAGPVFGCRRPG